MPHIRGILFDKDGTLVDFDRTWFAIGDMLALEAAGGDRLKADRLMAQAGYDFRAKHFVPDSVFAAGTNADVVALWYPDTEPTLRNELVTRFNGITAVNGAAKAVAVAGVRDALAALHQGGYRMGVATNDSTAGAQQTILMLGIASMFDAAYGYDAVARPKPAPDTVLAFCDLTGLSPSEIAIIGDNGHDIEMAHNAGCGLAIGVLSGTGTQETFKRARADAVLGSVAELPAFLASA
ncbi:MAG: HAD family hydrolase [Mesorhizobium sp.]|nr:HAD family hydrolase [Mesorhizobium sp.]MCO5160499.1 HAD family hydrolase [Mesorhizobium sp.]